MPIKKLISKIILIILGLIPLMATEDGEFVLLIFSVFVLLWLIAPAIKPIIRIIPIPLFIKFLFIGMVFGFITEYFVFLEGGIGITGESGLFSKDLLYNLILSMGIYDSLIIIWYFLLIKYKFSLAGVFFSAGIWGVVIEQDFAVLLSFNPLAYLYIFLAYGSLVSIPFILAEDGFNKIQRKENKVKYIIAFFAQFIVYIVGTLWILLLRSF